MQCGWHAWVGRFDDKVAVGHLVRLVPVAHADGMVVSVLIRADQCIVALKF